MLREHTKYMLEETKEMERRINNDLQIHVALSYFNRIKKLIKKGKITTLDADDIRVIKKFLYITGLKWTIYKN